MTEQKAELLTVADLFQISGQGLVVMPDFSVPAHWTETQVDASILLPDGNSIAARLSLTVTHFNIPDLETSSDRRWRVTPTFPGLTKRDVPIGSRVMIDSDIADQLLHQGPLTAP